MSETKKRTLVSTLSRFSDRSDILQSLDEVVVIRGISKPSKRMAFDFEQDDLLSRPNRSRFVHEEEVVVKSERDWKRPVLTPTTPPHRGIQSRGTTSPISPSNGKPKLDPMKSSLDDVAVDRGIVEESQSSFRFRRFERNDGNGNGNSVQVSSPKNAIPLTTDEQIFRHLGWPNSVISSPFRIIQFIAENKFLRLKIEIGKAKSVRRFTWHCRVTVGEDGIRGMADSDSRHVALEMACEDLLREMREIQPPPRVPAYDIPSQIFIDEKDLLEYVKTFGTRGQVECEMKRISAGKRSRLGYTCTYKFQGKEYAATHLTAKYAMVDAALKFHDEYLQRSFAEEMHIRYDIGWRECDHDGLTFDLKEVSIDDIVKGREEEENGFAVVAKDISRYSSRLTDVKPEIPKRSGIKPVVFDL